MEENCYEKGEQQTTDSQELKHRAAGKPQGCGEEQDGKDCVINPIHFFSFFFFSFGFDKKSFTKPLTRCSKLSLGIFTETFGSFVVPRISIGNAFSFKSKPAIFSISLPMCSLLNLTVAS